MRNKKFDNSETFSYIDATQNFTQFIGEVFQALEMARDYDHLFKLLIIGDSGKWNKVLWAGLKNDNIQ